MMSPIYHANQLAAYGMYGAGGDDTPEQQDFGADCIEAAIILWKMTNVALIKDPPEKLRICDKFYTEEELTEQVRAMRKRAEELRRQK